MIFIGIIAIFVLFKQTQAIGNILMNTDYYESLSKPTQCLVISHYHPTAPLFLFTTIEYKLYSYIYGFKSLNVSLDIGFKKIDNQCSNSIIFSILGDDFRKIKLKIYLSLFDNSGDLTRFEYTIFKGICSDNIELWDYDQNFYIHVLLIRGIYKNLIASEIDYSYLEYLFSLIPNDMRDICVTTENNKAIVLKPDWGHFKPEGYLIGFTTEFYRQDNYLASLNYPAFECNQNPDYQNGIVNLILDTPELELHYRGVYWKISEGIRQIEQYEFKLPDDFPSVYVNFLNYIPQEYKKLFIININIDIEICPDRTERENYLSSNNIIYYSREIKEVNVSNYLIQKRHISHSTIDPCNG